MKKKIMTLAVIFMSCTMQAQVGIGTTATKSDAILEISPTNKGILFPNLGILDVQNATPVTNPALHLTAYNNTPSYKADKGFYYWDGAKWMSMVDNENISTAISLTINVQAQNSGAVTTSSTSGSTTPYEAGDAVGSTWLLIPGLSQSVTIKNPANSLNIISEGMVQADNKSATGSAFSYAIAVFIDGKLHSARNYTVKGRFVCAYDFFSINSSAENLSLGTHKVETYATTRLNLTPDTTNSWTYGGIAKGCTNINTDMAKAFMNIKITQYNN